MWGTGDKQLGCDNIYVVALSINQNFSEHKVGNNVKVCVEAALIRLDERVHHKQTSVIESTFQWSAN